MLECFWNLQPLEYRCGLHSPATARQSQIYAYSRDLWWYDGDMQPHDSPDPNAKCAQARDSTLMFAGEQDITWASQLRQKYDSRGAKSSNGISRLRSCTVNARMMQERKRILARKWSSTCFWSPRLRDLGSVPRQRLIEFGSEFSGDQTAPQHKMPLSPARGP